MYKIDENSRSVLEDLAELGLLWISEVGDRKVFQISHLLSQFLGIKSEK